MLVKKVQGHYAYYGVSFNSDAMVGSATRSSGRGGVRYNAAPNDTSRGRQCNGS
jgi:hypothetical protein